MFSIRVTPMNSKTEVSGTSHCSPCPWRSRLHMTTLNYAPWQPPIPPTHSCQSCQSHHIHSHTTGYGNNSKICTVSKTELKMLNSLWFNIRCTNCGIRSLTQYSLTSYIDWELGLQASVVDDQWTAVYWWV